MRNVFILVYPWDTHQQVSWQKKEKKRKEFRYFKKRNAHSHEHFVFKTPTFCGCDIF
jgi:hypothetical protein